jgi:hypothetical protein
LTAAGLALLVIPALLSAPVSLIENVRILASYPGSDTALSVNAWSMPNWRGFVVSATNNEAVWLWMPGFLLIATAALGSAVWRWRHVPDFAQSYAIAVTLPLLVTPHLHIQSFVLLLLSGAIVLRGRLEASTSVRRETRAINVILLTYVAAFWLPFFAIQGLSLTVFPLLALYGALVLRWPLHVAEEEKSRASSETAARAA